MSSSTYSKSFLHVIKRTGTSARTRPTSLLPTPLKADRKAAPSSPGFTGSHSGSQTDPGVIPAEQRRSCEPRPAPGEGSARSPCSPLLSSPHAPTGAFPSARGCSAGAPTSTERPGTAPGTQERGKRGENEGRREGRSGCPRYPGPGRRCGAAAPVLPLPCPRPGSPTPHTPHSQPRGSCPNPEP